MMVDPTRTMKEIAVASLFSKLTETPAKGLTERPQPRMLNRERAQIIHVPPLLHFLPLFHPRQLLPLDLLPHDPIIPIQARAVDKRSDEAPCPVREEAETKLEFRKTVRVFERRSGRRDDAVEECVCRFCVSEGQEEWERDSQTTELKVRRRRTSFSAKRRKGAMRSISRQVFFGGRATEAMEIWSRSFRC